MSFLALTGLEGIINHKVKHYIPSEREVYYSNSDHWECQEMFEFAIYACTQNKPTTLLYRQRGPRHPCLTLVSETEKILGPVKGHM